jgi:hypothetical protein
MLELRIRDWYVPHHLFMSLQIGYLILEKKSYKKNCQGLKVMLPLINEFINHSSIVSPSERKPLIKCARLVSNSSEEN